MRDMPHPFIPFGMGFCGRQTTAPNLKKNRKSIYNSHLIIRLNRRRQPNANPGVKIASDTSFNSNRQSTKTGSYPHQRNLK
jgi:hypothetical protein